MTREEFVKQRCEIDKITEEEFEKIYRVVKCNCGEPYCKGYRCLNLDDLLKENQELKKQLEEERNKVREYSYKLSNFRCEETYENQQKEFIKYMNDIIEDLETEDVDDEEMKGYLIQRIDTFKEIFSKYKEIIGDDK